MATNAEDTQAGTDDQRTRLEDSLKAIINRLDLEAEQRVGKRDIVEKRWLNDLSQYHGRYTESLVKELTEARKSTLYINSTRPKTNTMASRLSDMLFPTDDRNWGIKPTPVPELTVEAEEAAQRAADAETAAAADPDNQQLQQAAQDATQRTDVIQARMDEARKRARAMEEEIDDHLREAKYSAQGRLVIEDASKLGTGIMKGPVIGERSRKAWQQQDRVDENGDVMEGGQGTGVFAMQNVEDPRPAFWRTNLWDFFPDMDATTIEDSEGNFERHLMNKKQLRRLAKQPGFDKDALRRLITMPAESSTPNYIADIRSITGAYHDSTTDRYHVWEYHGPLTLDEMRDIAVLMENDGILEDLEDLDVDPLDEIEAVVWFCQGELLKFGLHYLDSGEPIYSVFCLEKDDASIFGFGVPYIMRDPQKAMASAWRALMDNAGLSSGPQIVINDNVVEPQDGVWVIEPRKIWLRKSGAPKGEKPFEIIEITSNLDELTNLIEFCKKNVDEETNLPVIASGEQGAHVTKTATGMSLLMNSVNVVFRRIVKNWDDDLTTPTIRRTYDFLMQFSKKEHIKGDYEVDARGTSVLLVREMQSQNLLLFLTNFAGHAILGKYLKEEGLPALRALAQTMMIPANEIVKTNEEVAQDRAEAAKAPPQADPEIMKIEAMLNAKQMEWDGRIDLAHMERETALIKLAETSNMELDVLRAKLDDAREERRSKERMMATEAAVTQRQGASGGGHF